jgi:glucosamine-6-phosphate deaminase
MKTNLSSQITLNRVSPRYYRPENAFERSVLTRLEKIPTDIYESPEEGANQIALDIAQMIRDKQKAGRFCVLALAGGNSPRNVYSALVRMHKEEGLSFRNVVVFNLYEYYPLASDAVNSNLNSLKEMLLDHVDIDMQNVFSPSGTIAKDTIFEYCRLYEQRIESFGGIDIAVLGIGRVGNIGFNEPGESFDKQVHCVNLTESTIEANKRFFASAEDVPKQAYTMGIKTIMQAKKILIVASGEDKAEIVQKAFFGPITPQVPASVLQLHNDVTLVADEAALSKLSE